MKYGRQTARVLVLAALLGGLGADPTAAQDAPSFLEVGRSYLFIGVGDGTPVEVLEIGNGPWVRVRLDDFDDPVWFNMNTVGGVIEMTPELMARFDEQRNSAFEQAYRAAMRLDLRNLVFAQEAYYMDHLRYGTLEELGEGYLASEGITIEISHATDDGWRATATHTEARGVCHIYVGAPPPQVRGMTEGEPFCQ